ncbi:MAG: CoA pyrophosphatase [Deltaproteobacteria bacterium]|nr:CoA pyrophosphatase [Deltaproteobacteria bacterium]
MERSRRKLESLERALRRHRPQRVALDGFPTRAAVGMILDPRPDDLHLFFIHRAEVDGDPWSGHMGFPGGRMDPEDPDVLGTVLREVDEEVGIDLGREGRLIAALDEIQGVARGRHLPLVISPFVFALEQPVEPRPNHEVQSVLWVPLSFLAAPENESLVEHRIDGQPMRLPAYVYGERTIWGLTFRMIRSLLEAASRATEG